MGELAELHTLTLHDNPILRLRCVRERMRVRVRVLVCVWCSAYGASHAAHAARSPSEQCCKLVREQARVEGDLQQGRDANP